MRNCEKVVSEMFADSDTKTYPSGAILVSSSLRNRIWLNILRDCIQEIARKVDHRLRLIEDGFSRIAVGGHDGRGAHKTCASTKSQDWQKAKKRR